MERGYLCGAVWVEGVVMLWEGETGKQSLKSEGLVKSGPLLQR